MLFGALSEANAHHGVVFSRPNRLHAASAELPLCLLPRFTESGHNVVYRYNSSFSGLIGQGTVLVLQRKIALCTRELLQIRSDYKKMGSCQSTNNVGAVKVAQREQKQATTAEKNQVLQTGESI